MARKLKGTSDDGLSQVRITDFSGGLNTMAGPLSLASNESPQLQNCVGYPGRLLYPGGVAQKCSLPTGYSADQAYQFYDASGNLHQCVWANGNLYDCANGTYSLVKSAVYTAGQRVGVTDQNGILYYTTTTVPLRQWDGTTEKATPNSGATGAVPPPSGTYLASYAGSLVMANVTINSGGSTYYPGGFLNSNVNDPTTWLASNLNQLGTNNFIEFILPMGVSAAGIPPTASILIGTSRLIFLYQGAVNALTQKIVNCPVGCADPQSVVYLPGADLFGSAIFLGSDYQFWRTNGVTAECISTKILNFCLQTAKNSISLNPTQKFSASYNNRYQYYFCDMGQNQHLVYRWKTDAWFYFNGYPSGFLFEGNDGNGYPSNFSASTSSTYPAGLYSLNVDGVNFYGTNPSIFYQTPYLHGGDSGLEKDWQWIELDTLNNANTYSVQGTTLPRSDNSTLTSNLLTLANPQPTSAATGAGIWDVSLWDDALWAGGLSPYLATPYVAQGMLSVAVGGLTEWVPKHATQPLRSAAATFTISSVAVTNGQTNFDIIGFTARFNPRGRKTVGGQLYTAQSGTTSTGNNYFIN